MKTVLVICPQFEDMYELSRSHIRENYRVLFSDYDVSVLDKILCGGVANTFGVRSPQDYITYLESLCDCNNIDAVVTSNDYPGILYTSLLAERREYCAPSLWSVLQCQNKYLSRIAQKKYVPEAIPKFAVINQSMMENVPLSVPFFIKPIKAFLSLFACQINNMEELKGYFEHAKIPELFFRPLDWFANQHADLFENDSSYFLVEELLHGRQVTLEGFAYNNNIEVTGVVDSIMIPGTISFQRFEYPSSLSENIQNRMIDITRRFMNGIGFNNGIFNIEFMYNSDADQVHIIEVNSRMSEQFADLFEKVNGVSSYDILLSLAFGNKPEHKKSGEFLVAASFVLRKLENKRVVRVPSKAQIEKAKLLFPELRFYPWVVEGNYLSDVLQDGVSYVYCLIHLGARDHQELQEKFEHCKRILGFEFEDI